MYVRWTDIWKTCYDSISGNNVKIATEEEGIKEVCNVLKVHMNSSEVAEAACASILALSLDGKKPKACCTNSPCLI